VQSAADQFSESWTLDESGGYSTKFVVKVLGEVAASDAADPARLMTAAGIDLKALAKDDAALEALLATANVTI
jgi:hypothetical protein